MRSEKWLGILFLGLAVTAAMPVAKASALVIIDEISDDVVVGDFQIVGNDIASGTGLNYEVLKFKPNGSATVGTAEDGLPPDTAPHGDVKVGQLWTLLDDGGINTATKLAFGFDVNQISDYIDIDDLLIEVHRGATVYSYELDDTVRIYDDISGNGSSTAEARFIIDLGFDFMTAYSSASTDEFLIRATHSSANDGFDEYFLSSAFTLLANPDPSNTIPEPASLLLMGSGLAGLAGFRRKK